MKQKTTKKITVAPNDNAWKNTLHAAVDLGCSVQTLYRWVNTKSFPDEAVKRNRFGSIYDVEKIRSWATSRAQRGRGRPFFAVNNAS
jgi:predicted DNA-binding transcriptional regulator AlpA